MKIRDDMIISNADKGGEVVIQDVKDYTGEVEWQLNNKQYFREISHNSKDKQPS